MAKNLSAWPVIKTYDLPHTQRIAMPLGGIGTGTISLGGRGELRDWEIVNRPAKEFAPANAFFALWVRPAGGEAIARLLEGPIPLSAYDGGSGSRQPNHGLPRFRRCSFSAAYPLGQVHLSDPHVPLKVRIEAFNPMVPADPDASGIPVAILRFVLTNPTRKAVRAAVCGSLQNFTGYDGSGGKARNNRNVFRDDPAGVRGLFMQCGGDPAAEQWGTMALATTARGGVTHRTNWKKLGWGGSLVDFWDDFSADGSLDEREPVADDHMPTGSLAAPVVVPAGGEKAVTFLIAWHFPNRMTWSPPKKDAVAGAAPGCCAEGGCGDAKANPDWVGNFYTTRYADAWDVAAKTAAGLPALEAGTVRFVRALVDSDYPVAVKEAALATLVPLRTQSCFRTADGRFYGWEGCNDKSGCCPGSCTHVWNYEQTVAFLYGSLSRSMREVEFQHATNDAGHMCFRVNLPLGRENWFLAAADGQMGCLVKLYLDWKLSGDDAMLRTLWPRARKALEFAWIPGGWDADRDGVMEGCQHNTMDVEYYGPNPQVNMIYLAALRAAAELAGHLGEADFASTCRDLAERGGRWMDEHLFNGSFYVHEIRPIADASTIAPGLRHDTMGAKDTANPDLQLGPACEVNQIFGQFLADVAGLGNLTDAKNMSRAVRSLLKHNFRDNLHDHFNYRRSYALADEAGLLISTWPLGGRPANPMPYGSEVWTSMEYMLATMLIRQGMVKEAMTLITAARARHDGLKRNPFDEVECGHHYVRPMDFWAVILALSGFHYNATDGVLQFAPAKKPATWFWASGDAWGTLSQTPGTSGVQVRLAVFGGAIRVKTLSLGEVGAAELSSERIVDARRPLKLTIPRSRR